MYYKMKKIPESFDFIIGKRMTSKNAYYEALNAAQESGQRMGYARGRDETAREIFQALKDKGIIYCHFDRDEHLVITMDRLKALAQKYGIEIEEE